MNALRSTILVFFATALWLGSLIAAAWAVSVKSNPPITIRGAGSTFASLLYAKWINAFSSTFPNVTINYDAVGSDEGIARFIGQTVDFAGTDALMTEAEVAKVRNGVIMVPTTAGMTVLAYNLPGLKGAIRLPRDAYADIFAGRIKRWDDPRLLEANPGVTLPHLDIVRVARRDVSGATAVFTRHLATISPAWRNGGFGIGQSIQWPEGTILADGNEGVIARLKISEGAIGYVQYGFAKQFVLSIAALQNKASAFVLPDARSGQLAVAEKASSLNELDASVIDPAESGAYPIVSYSWIAINKSYDLTLKGGAVREFVNWGLSSGQNDGVDLGYIPLARGIVALSKKALGGHAP